MEGRVNNGQPVAQSGLQAIPLVEADSTCGSGFCRSIQRALCSCFVRGTDDAAEQVVVGFRPAREREVHPNNEALQINVLQERGAEINLVVDEYLSSSGSSQDIGREDIFYIAICWLSNKPPGTEISAKRIFETEVVESDAERDARCRIEKCEEKIKTLSYEIFPEYKPRTSEELKSAEECCLSDKPSDQMIRYQKIYFCDYDFFIASCRNTQWLDPFSMEGEVDFGEIEQVIPARSLSGEVNLGYEAEGSEVMDSRL